MRLSNKIFSIILTGFFLLSNTGISLMLHHCLACDETEYFLAAYNNEIKHHHHNDCHEYDEDVAICNIETHSCEHIHSCGIFSDETESCKTQVQYLKSDFESLLTNTSDNLIQPAVSIPEDITLMDVCCRECGAGKILKDYIDPPPKLVSRAFIVFAHQLKYC